MNQSPAVSHPLTPRQWWLYRYLTAAFENDNQHYVTDLEAYNAFMSDLKAVTELENYPKIGHTFHSSTARPLSSDWQAIMDTREIQKVILSSSKGHKLAIDKEEAMPELERKKKSLLIQLERYYHQLSKVNLDGQGKLVFDSKSKAREYFESFPMPPMKIESKIEGDIETITITQGHKNTDDWIPTPGIPISPVSASK